LAEQINADVFVILTDVEVAYIDFLGPNKKAIRDISVADAEKLCNEGTFGKGSMEPK